MTTMTEEDKEAAAAYMKLHDDVKSLIIETVYNELTNYGSLFHAHIKANILPSYDLEVRVKDIVRNQMSK
jgi:hypothetical protein